MEAMKVVTREGEAEVEAEVEEQQQVEAGKR